MLADLHSLNVEQVADEIASIRAREGTQLAVVFAILVGGLVVAAWSARRVQRSITTPLLALEDAASHFGSDDLSHRTDPHGDDELARVGQAFNDMAAKLQMSREDLHHQARHDSLTGLPNRSLFMLRVERALARSQQRGNPFCVLYADLDGFKAVNDAHGHHAGDELLVQAADRFRSCLRPNDLVARLGGDEFGLLLEDTELSPAASVAERLVRSFDDPFLLAAGTVSVRVSVGVTAADGEDAVDQLLRQADAAMYAAKAAGKHRWQLFAPDMGVGVRAADPRRDELARAIDDDELVVHYQPIVNTADGTVHAVEALVRWQHPERGLLGPAEFLDLADEAGCLPAIDRRVMHEACRQVRAWQQSIPGAEALTASVNVSSRLLQEPGLGDEIAAMLQSSGLAPEHLIVEITETGLLPDTPEVLRELWQIKMLGVVIALDDFGTGYSSLTHLHSVPVDVIKVDRSFVGAIGTDRARSEMALALVMMSTSLGLRTVAEGVETPLQLELLRAAGCAQAQGYLFAKPLARDELACWLTVGGGTALMPAGRSGTAYE